MVEGSATNSVRALALPQLVALNDEIAALARAGLPMERGLLGAGGDLPGRLGAITRGLGERMSRGRSLPEALTDEGPAIPPMYRAVVEAGLRTGRLPSALEGVAAFAKHYIELRRVVGQALLYPLLVLGLAYALLIGFLIELIPRLRWAFQSFQLPVHRPLLMLERIGGTALYWGPILPAVLLVCIMAWWWSGRSRALTPGGRGGLMGWLPWMGSILANWRVAHFADWLALLVEHDVPLPEAIGMAAEATGDPGIRREALVVTEALRLGAPEAEGLRQAEAFPPVLGWLMITGRRQNRLPSALRHAAETYRRRAYRRAELVRLALPGLLLIVIGAGASIAYAVTLFWPWSMLLRDLG